MDIKALLNENCHNPFMGYFSKLHIFLSKINKGCQHGESMSGRILKIHKNQAVILEEIRGLIVPRTKDIKIKGRF